MKAVLIFVVFLLSSVMVMAGEGNFEKAAALLQSGDIPGVEKIIAEWEKKAPDDPELYVIILNCAFVKAQEAAKNRVQIKPGIANDPKKDSIVLKDKKTGEEVAAITDAPADAKIMKEGAAKFRKGLAKHPARLDMHMGLLYMENESELYDDVVVDILALLQVAAKNPKWLWSFNKPYDKDSNELIVETVQRYLFGLLQVDEQYIEKMLIISKKMIEAFPKHKYGYNNIAHYFSIKKDLKQSLEYTIKAYAIDNKDLLVISNMAYLYKETGDKVNAKKYYQMIIDSGDKRLKKKAEQGLIDLAK